MKDKIRITHLISSLGIGGCETMLLRTLPMLSDSKFEHTVITLFRPGELANEFEKKGIRISDIGMSHVLDVRSLRKAINNVNKYNPRLVLTYLFHADMIGRLYIQQRVNAPVVPFLRTTYNFPRYLPARILERMTRGLVGHYFANSDAVKEYYVFTIGVSPQKITVIPNGIDPSIYDMADGARIVKELGFPKQRFVITCVANLAPNKGHRYLLEAFEALYQTHPEAWLIVVGDGPEKESLIRQANNYRSKPHILFLDVRRDVPNILAASDVFVLLTLFEGMSNATLAAMAAKLPVVTTDIPENRVMITDYDSGLLVKPGSPQAVQQAIEQLIADHKLRQRLGQSARKIVEHRFSSSKILALWRDALRKYSQS